METTNGQKSVSRLLNSFPIVRARPAATEKMRFAVMLSLAVALVAAETSHHYHAPLEQEHSAIKSYAHYVPMPYNFKYAVNDRPSANDYGHQEESDGQVVTGFYYVLLPDGRRQVVTYKADRDGYRADVKYEEAADEYPRPYYHSYPTVSYPRPAHQAHHTEPTDDETPVAIHGATDSAAAAEEVNQAPVALDEPSPEQVAATEQVPVDEPSSGVVEHVDEELSVPLDGPTATEQTATEVPLSEIVEQATERVQPVDEPSTEPLDAEVATEAASEVPSTTELTYL